MLNPRASVLVFLLLAAFVMTSAVATAYALERKTAAKGASAPNIASSPSTAMRTGATSGTVNEASPDLASFIPATSAHGALRANGPSLGGAWSFEPGTCISGERHQYHGVELGNRENPKQIVRVVDDAIRGPSISVNEPASAKGWRFEPQECKSLLVKIRSTNTTVNRVRVLDGHIDADCTLPDGTTFSGEVTFAGCY